GQPGPEDIDRRVQVGVVAMTARRALEVGAGAVVRSDVPAGSAALGGMTGIDLDQLPASIFRFVGQHSFEDSPSRVEDGTVQPGLGGPWRPGPAGVGPGAERSWPGGGDFRPGHRRWWPPGSLPPGQRRPGARWGAGAGPPRR